MGAFSGESRGYYETVFDLVCTERVDSPGTLVLESRHVHFFMQECRGDTDCIEKQHISFEVDRLSGVISNLENAGISDYTTGEVAMKPVGKLHECDAHTVLAVLKLPLEDDDRLVSHRP